MWKLILQFLKCFFQRLKKQPIKPHEDVIILNEPLDKRIKYKTSKVDDVPDIIEDGYIYIIGDKGYEWQVALKCPCGCNEVIQLSLLKDVKPRWSIECHMDQTITLSPSIDRLYGCRSHFNVKKGYVLWWSKYSKN